MQFGGAWASFTVNNDAQITATVPTGAVSGPILVGGTKSQKPFVVQSTAPPTVTGFSPAVGSVGAYTRISGLDFTGTTGVSFNGVPSQTFFVEGDQQISAYVPPGATTGPISVTNTLGTAASSSDFTVLPPPVLSGFSPASGAVGDSIVMTGTGLLGVTAVDFNGVHASFNIDSGTQITALVPASAATGPIRLNNSVSSPKNFVILDGGPPAISGFSPISGGSGNKVTILGSSLGGTTSVSFGGVAAQFTAQDDGTIFATVPTAAVTGPITVVNNAGSTVTSTSFTILPPPSIVSFSPPSGTAGSTVTIVGTGFTGTQNVRFGPIGGIDATSFSVVDDSHLTATVPPGAITGPIEVDASTGSAHSTKDFSVLATAPPRIAMFSPPRGGVGTIVTLTGTGFTGASSVSFGGVPAVIFGAKSDTTLLAAVPSGAVSGPIVVVNGKGTASSGAPFTVDHSFDMTITSVNPAAGKPGTVVTITGTNLDGAQVGFGMQSPAPVTSNTGTTVVVTVPPDAATGNVFALRMVGNQPVGIATFPFTVYVASCAGVAAGAPCGLCTACDGAGKCSAAALDDSGCGVIDCDGRDNGCGDFQDLTALRCKAAGACKAPNSADCTSVTPAQAAMPCGTCASCDGKGLCAADLSRDTDCPACEECADVGKCAPETAGADSKNDCPTLPCHTGACDGQGACGLLVSGTPCDDGNACTKTDVCTAGACTGGNPVTCPAPDACHDVGACDPLSGACGNPVAMNGTPCDDGIGCTLGDSCQAGVCTPASSICSCTRDSDCAPKDQCHVAGRCNLSTHTCTNPTIADGTACDDGDACTSGETCQAGVCGSPSSRVSCAASDACHDVGRCDTTSGKCTNPAKADGTQCSDGVACTTGDSCQAGVCVPSGSVCQCFTDSDCRALDQCHVAGTCNRQLHLCTNPFAAEETPCNDANACTSGEACHAGTCGSPKSTIVCPPPDDCHATGACDTATGACAYAPKVDGSVCPSGLCTRASVFRRLPMRERAARRTLTAARLRGGRRATAARPASMPVRVLAPQASTRAPAAPLPEGRPRTVRAAPRRAAVGARSAPAARARWRRAAAARARRRRAAVAPTPSVALGLRNPRRARETPPRPDLAPEAVPAPNDPTQPPTPRAAACRPGKRRTPEAARAGPYPNAVRRPARLRSGSSSSVRGPRGAAE